MAGVSPMVEYDLLRNFGSSKKLNPAGGARYRFNSCTELQAACEAVKSVMEAVTYLTKEISSELTNVRKGILDEPLTTTECALLNVSISIYSKAIFRNHDVLTKKLVMMNEDIKDHREKKKKIKGKAQDGEEEGGDEDGASAAGKRVKVGDSYPTSITEDVSVKNLVRKVSEHFLCLTSRAGFQGKSPTPVFDKDVFFSESVFKRTALEEGAGGVTGLNFSNASVLDYEALLHVEVENAPQTISFKAPVPVFLVGELDFTTNFLEMRELALFPPSTIIDRPLLSLSGLGDWQAVCSELTDAVSSQTMSETRLLNKVDKELAELYKDKTIDPLILRLIRRHVQNWAAVRQSNNNEQMEFVNELYFPLHSLFRVSLAICPQVGGNDADSMLKEATLFLVDLTTCKPEAFSKQLEVLKTVLKKGECKTYSVVFSVPTEKASKFPGIFDPLSLEHPEVTDAVKADSARVTKRKGMDRVISDVSPKHPWLISSLIAAPSTSVYQSAGQPVRQETRPVASPSGTMLVSFDLLFYWFPSKYGEQI
jgi:hypothetical protein